MIRKVRIAQATLVFGITAGLLIGLPGFLHRQSSQDHEGLILVNGRIEATEVSVGTKLPGRVLAVHVQQGQAVKAGQLIAELEADDVAASYEQALASVAEAKHNLAGAREQEIRSQQQLAKAKIALTLTTKRTALAIEQADAAIERAKAGVDQASAKLHRAKTAYEQASELVKRDAASDREFSDAKDARDAHQAAVQMAKQELEQARNARKLAVYGQSEIDMCKHDLAVMESTVRQAGSAVGIAQARLEAVEAWARIVKIKLAETRIHAPCNGVVVTRVVEPGEIVGAGATIAVVVDFNQLYLKGYLPNKQIGKVKLNDPARVFLDAFPDCHFNAHVTRIHQQAEFTPKNVDTPQQRVKLVFAIELTVDNSDRDVKPGMPADSVIKIDKKAVWKTPTDLR